MNFVKKKMSYFQQTKKKKLWPNVKNTISYNFNFNIVGIPEECFYCKTRTSTEFVYVKSENTNGPLCVCYECNMKLTSAPLPFKPPKSYNLLNSDIILLII